MKFQSFVSAAVVMASTTAHALQAEPVDFVAVQLSETWSSSCVRVPLGVHKFSPKISNEPSRPGVLNFEQARNLEAWGTTGAVTVTFSDHAGQPALNAPLGGGSLLVELAAADDPLIEIAADKKTACFLQGTFENIHPTSIVPVDLDDGRPARLYFFTYTANWTPALEQRYGMASERIAAALVSFNPGVGWDRIEAFRTEDKGQQFLPDTFKGDGLSYFEAAHPDTIEILDVPAGYPVSTQPLAVRYATPVPASVASCRERDHWETPACLENLAQGGAILGALSLCRRDDIGCLMDLLYASSPETIADQCLALQDKLPTSTSRCQAFAALHDNRIEPAEAMPNWRGAKLVRIQGADNGASFFLRAHSVEYGPLEEFEISNRTRSSGTPYVEISCNAGLLDAAVTFIAHPPYWQTGEHVASNVQGLWAEDNDFSLIADRNGKTLVFNRDEAERFLQHAFSSESFRLTTSGSVDMRVHVSVRDVVSAFGGAIDLPLLLSDAGCGKSVERALQ